MIQSPVRFRTPLTVKDNLKRNLKLKRVKTICEVCLFMFNVAKLEQHRIIPRGDYSDDNVIIACNSCHKLIHKMYRLLIKTKSYEQIIEVAKDMVRS